MRDTWGEKFEQDVRNEVGMNVLSKLDREDERRRYLDVLLAKRKPGSKVDERDLPLLAHCRCNNRRRWLLEELPLADLEAYIRGLDAAGEVLVWDHLRKKMAAVSDKAPLPAPGAAEADVPAETAEPAKLLEEVKHTGDPSGAEM